MTFVDCAWMAKAPPPTRVEELTSARNKALFFCISLSCSSLRSRPTDRNTDRHLRGGVPHRSFRLPMTTLLLPIPSTGSTHSVYRCWLPRSNQPCSASCPCRNPEHSPALSCQRSGRRDFPTH